MLEIKKYYPKIKPLNLSIALTIVEIIIFVAIAYLSIDNTSKINQCNSSLIKNLLPNFGNLIIAIATTWYVVFTYFILRRTEQIAKKTSEPYVSISWSQASSFQEEKFDYDEKVKAEISRHTGSSFFDNLSNVTDNLTQRYINIDIKNERSAILGLLDINLEITFIPSSELKNTTLDPIHLNWKKDCSKILGGGRFSITVADLAHIPNIFSIAVKILNCSYTSNDSNDIINDFKGNRVSEYQGIAMIQAAIPSPIET